MNTCYMQSVQERPEMNRGQAAPSCNFRGFSVCSPAARNKDQRTSSGLPYSPWSLLKLKCLTLSLLWSLSALLKHYLKDYFVSLPKQSPTHFKLSLAYYKSTWRDYNSVPLHHFSLYLWPQIWSLWKCTTLPCYLQWLHSLVLSSFTEGPRLYQQISSITHVCFEVFSVAKE